MRQDRSGVELRTIIDDERHVEGTAGFQASGDPRRSESARGGDSPCRGVPRHGATPSTASPAPSSRPEHDVGVLDGLTGGALDQVVDGAHDDDPSSGDVNSHL